MRSFVRDDIEAALAAKMSIVVFRVSLSRWIDATDDLDLRTTIHQTLDHLRIFSAHS